MAAATPDISGCVTVPLEYLRELELLKSKIPDLIAKAKATEERNKERIAHLRARDAADPEAPKRRVNKYRENNREKLNARRRELYKQKKESASAPASAMTTPT